MRKSRFTEEQIVGSCRSMRPRPLLTPPNNGKQKENKFYL